MTDTPNHGYYTPSKGTTDWHIPLNENFKSLDQAVAIRDLAENMNDYAPESGAKFEALDTGTVYYGNGNSWQKTGRNLGSVTTDSLAHPPGEGTTQSLFSNLSGGLVVGFAGGTGKKIKSVDLAEARTHDTAIQEVADWLSNNGGGDLHIPVTDSTGTEVTITNTIVIKNINLYFYGANFDEGSGITAFRTTINDGSPMFLLDGSTTTGDATRGLRFIGGHFSLDDNDATLIRARNNPGMFLYPYKVHNFSGTAFHIDSNCWAWKIGPTRIGPHNTSAIAIKLTETLGLDTPNDGAISPMFSLEGDNHIGLLNKAPAANIRIGGNWEGAHGRAEIDNGYGGKVIITPYCNILRTHNGAHGIYADGGGGHTLCAPSILQMIDGDGIHAGPNNPIVDISNHIRYINNSGHAINIENVAGGYNPSQVPYEETIKGTVSYPDTPWDQLRYHDGWRKQAAGTTEVSPNSVKQVVRYLKRDGTEFKIGRWSFDSNAVNSPMIQFICGFDNNTGTNAIYVKESNGGSGTISWEAFTR